MRQESYKILAEHFADKTGLTVEFIDGACPSTDGSTVITLPTEVNDKCVDPLLGAILHETAHVKNTASPYDVFGGKSEFFKDCINCLEDIRVDYLTSLQYPNSYDFIRALTQSVIDRKSEQLTKEPIPVQVLKSLCLKAEGFDPKALYKDPVTQAQFTQCEKYIDQAKACVDTWGVVSVARRLLIDLCAQDPQKNKELQVKAQGVEDSTKKMREIEQQYSQGTAQEQSLGEQLHEKNRQIRKQRQVLDRLQRQSYRPTQGSAERQELEKKCAEKGRVIETMSKDYDKSAEEYRKNEQERNAMRQAYSDARTDTQKREQEIKDETKHVNPGRGLSLSGFGALDAEALKPDFTAKLETKTIDEITAEALLARKDEIIVDEQGNRLNNEALADYETEPDKLFAVKEPRHDLTKVAFVIDVSGSMGGFEDGSRLRLAFDTLDVLMRSVKGAIDQGAPCEVSLYAFGTECKRVFEGLAHYETEKTKLLLNKERYNCGGGTDLLNAVNKVSADLLSEAEHRALILITDADVNHDHCTEIINKTSGDCKQVFIAVHANLSGKTAELFGRNNILDRKSAMDVIGQALYGAL